MLRVFAFLCFFLLPKLLPGGQENCISGISFPLDVMTEHTTEKHNVMQNIANDEGVSREGGDVAEDARSDAVEGYNNFKKLHATEKKVNLRYHPYEQPFTVSTTTTNSKNKWSFNPFAVYDDSSDEDDNPEPNLVEKPINPPTSTNSRTNNEANNNDEDEQVSDAEKDATEKQIESDDVSTDFFNLKNSKKASLLSLIQGYREEDVDEAEETSDHYGSSVDNREKSDTRATVGPSAEQPTANRSNNYLTGYTLKLPEHQPLTWNPVNRGFIKQKTSLSTYKCWKCNRPGHFAEDCTMFINVPAQSTRNPNQYEVPEHYESVDKHGQTQIYTPLLRKMYKRCKKLGQSNDKSCVTCGDRTHLVQCLDCDTTFCDGSGHIAQHLKQFPGHHKLYSFKIHRQIKCSKATCEEMSVYDVWACQDCLLNLFHRHYSMATGLWTEKGLKYLANTVCCEEHFEWHRVNCKNAMVDSEHVVELDKLNGGSYDRALNEYLF